MRKLNAELVFWLFACGFVTYLCGYVLLRLITFYGVTLTW